MGFALFREELQLGFHRAERRKAAAMDRRRPFFVYRGVMLRGSVSLGLGKSVAGINLVQLPHLTITCYLGQDTRRSDGIAFAIALDQRGLRISQPADS